MALLRILFCLSLLIACDGIFTGDEGETKTEKTVWDDIDVPKGNKKLIGIRNFREIDEIFSMLTGIEHLEHAYQKEVSGLPLNNEAHGFSTQANLSILRLATAYCEELVYAQSDVLLAKFPQLDFISLPEEVFAADQRPKIAKAFFDAFWGQTLTVPYADGIEEELANYIGERLNDSGDMAISNSGNMYLEICTIVLASAPVIFH